MSIILLSIVILSIIFEQNILANYPNYLVFPKIDSSLCIVDNPNALVLAGGGAKGVAYVGVLNYLRGTEHGKNIYEGINKFAGSSAGALFALIFYLDFSEEEAQQILDMINWSEFLDSEVPLLELLKNKEELKSFENIGKILGKIPAKYGLVEGKNLRIFIANKILQDHLNRHNIKKSDGGYVNGEQITFGELKGYVKQITGKEKDLSIFACSTNYNSLAHFSAERTPDIKVVDAILGSMAIPFIFKPVRFENDLFIDGGTANNYPIDFWDDDPNIRALGFILEPYWNRNFSPVKNIVDYTLSVTSVAIENIIPKIETNSYRTVFIDTQNLENNIPPVKTLSFDMSLEQQDAAINAGFNALNNYYAVK